MVNFGAKKLNAGAYGSFMLHSRRAAEKFGVDASDILLELGRRKTVGGQEDLIIDVAIELAQQKQAVSQNPLCIFRGNLLF